MYSLYINKLNLPVFVSQRKFHSVECAILKVANGADGKTQVRIIEFDFHRNLITFD